MSGLARHCRILTSLVLALAAAGVAATPAGRTPELSIKVDLHGERLPPGAVARIGTSRYRGFLSLAHDGRTLLTLRENRGCLINPDTGREIRRLPGGDPVTAEAHSCLLSPDGRYIAYGCFSFVDIWNVASGQRVCHCAENELALGGLECHPLCFSPDSKRLVTVAQNSFIPSQCWDVETGRLVWQIEQTNDDVNWLGIAFTPDGRYFVTVRRRQDDWLLCVLAAETGAVVHKVAVGHPVNATALSPDGTQVAYSENQGKVHRINIWTGIEEKVLDLPYSLVAESLVYSPDGTRLVGVHPMGLNIWDTASGKELHRILGIRQLIQARAFIAADNKTLWAADHDEPVWHKVDITKGREIKLPDADLGGQISTMAVAHDGKSVAASGSSSGTRVWSAETGVPQRRLYDGGLLLTASSPELNAIAFSPDGKQIAGAQMDGRLHFWNAATGTLQRTVPGKEEFTGESIAYSPDGKSVALAPMYVRDPQSEGIRLFDPGSGKEKLKLPGTSGLAACLSFSPDSALLLAQSALEGETAAIVYDVATGAVVRQAHGEVNAAAFLSFGRNVLCSKHDGLVLWELSSGTARLRIPLPEREGLIDLLAVSPDGRLAAGANNGAGHYRVYLWDLRTGRELAPIVGHNHYITGLAFGPSARMLVTASKDTTALVWDLSDRLTIQVPPPATPAEFAAAWEALADDAESAHAAQEKLLAAGDTAVNLLRQRLPAAAPIDTGSIYRAISRLDAPRFADRERATRELERWDQQAEPLLRAARDGSRSAEARRRLDALLTRSRSLSVDGEQLRATRSVELLERLNSPAARRLLADWARGDAAARLTREAKHTLERLRPKG